MQLTRFTDPVRFHDHVASYLSQQEAENNLLLGLVKGISTGEYREHPPYMACVEQDGEIVLISLRTPPMNVLLSNSGVAPTEAVNRLAEDVYQTYGADIPGVVGTEANATSFSTAWHQLSQRNHKPKLAMRIYKLVEVIPVKDVPGSMRRADEADRDLLYDWMRGFYTDALHDNLNDEQIATQVDRYLSADPANRGLMLWEVDGEVVSMAGYMGPTPHGMRVGAVYTPEEQRKKGYASAVTASVSQHILDSGRDFCFLFTDLSNPTSNHIYQEIGYKPVSDVVEWEFE